MGDGRWGGDLGTYRVFTVLTGTITDVTHHISTHFPEPNKADGDSEQQRHLLICQVQSTATQPTPSPM